MATVGSWAVVGSVSVGELVSFSVSCSVAGKLSCLLHHLVESHTDTPQLEVTAVLLWVWVYTLLLQNPQSLSYIARHIHMMLWECPFCFGTLVTSG